jgi:hypothetical protein
MDQRIILIALLGSVLLTGARVRPGAAQVWLQCSATGDEADTSSLDNSRSVKALSETVIFVYDKTRNDISAFDDGRTVPNDTSLAIDPKDISQNSSSVDQNSMILHEIRSTYQDGRGQPYRDTTEKHYAIDRGTLQFRITLSQSLGPLRIEGAATGACHTIAAPTVTKNVF